MSAMRLLRAGDEGQSHQNDGRALHPRGSSQGCICQAHVLFVTPLTLVVDATHAYLDLAFSYT
jgi:hypothetical protein